MNKCNLERFYLISPWNYPELPDEFQSEFDNGLFTCCACTAHVENFLNSDSHWFLTFYVWFMPVNTYRYIIIKVTWFKELDHFQLTGTHHQIKLDAPHLVWSDLACQPNVIRHFGSSYCNNDKFIIYPSNVIEKPWNKYLGSTAQCLFTKVKNTIFSKELFVIFFMRTINHERVLELKFILNASERWVYVLEQDFESYTVHDTDLAQCNMLDVTILHVLCIEKKRCVLRHQFLRWVIWILVIQSIRSHSVKSTASRLIKMMGF